MAPSDDEARREILRKVTEGFHLLSDLHVALGSALEDPEVARAHVTQATRELASVQRMLDRRTEA